MNVLMISGDISAVNNENGPFCETLSGLAKYYSQIYVFCPEADADLDRDFLPNVKLRSRKLSLTHRLFFFPEILDFIKNKQIDLVVSHDYGFMLNGINGMIVSKRIAAPHISEIFHLEGHPKAENFKEVIFSIWGKMYIRLIKNHISLFRVMNKQIIENLFIKLNVTPSKISNINAIYINKKFYYPKIVPKKFDFIFCGRFSSNKGIDLFLSAIRDLKKDFPKTKSVMIGRGPLLEFTKKYINKHNLKENILIIPRVESEYDLAEYYHKSRFLICASSVEGGPRVTIEALACGTPIISTAVGVVPEIISSGVNGILIGQSPKELLSAVQTAMHLDLNEYQKLVDSTQNGLARFDATESMKNIFTNYQSVVDSHLACLSKH